MAKPQPQKTKRPHQTAESLSDLQVRRLKRLESAYDSLEQGLEEFEKQVAQKLPELGIELEPSSTKPKKSSISRRKPR